jgi:flagellar motility protein MotE (MotC chaperone)
MPNGTVRAHFTQDSPEERSVESWGGIVSARLEDLARELGTTTEAIAQAVEEGEAEPLVDTARQKKRERDRPTDPALRSLAFTTEELRSLRSAVGEGE